MFFCGVCFVIALVIKAAAENPAMLYAGRAFLGAAAAFSNTAIQVSSNSSRNSSLAPVSRMPRGALSEEKAKGQLHSINAT